MHAQYSFDSLPILELYAGFLFATAAFVAWRASWWRHPSRAELIGSAHPKFDKVFWLAFVAIIGCVVLGVWAASIENKYALVVFASGLTVSVAGRAYVHARYPAPDARDGGNDVGVDYRNI